MDVQNRQFVEAMAELDDDELAYLFAPASNCRVCEHEQICTLVNKLLSHAMSYRAILELIAPLNDLLPERKRVTVKVIGNHSRRHFPIERTAQSVYRRIVERRAEEFGLDLADGVGGVLTTVGYLEVLMQKAYEAVVDPQAVVRPELGMRAAVKLHQITQQGSEDVGIADLMIRLDVIIDAVRTTVPEELWEPILNKITTTTGEKSPTSALGDVREGRAERTAVSQVA